VLRAHESGTLRSVLSGPVVAGATDVVLRLPEGATWPRVRGTVVSRSGAPLAGVSVIPAMITDEQPWGSAWESGRPVVTDEDGAFVIADFPRERVHLDVAGEEVVPERFRPGPSDDLDALRLVVAQRCHFRIAVTGNDPGPMFARIVDAAGKQLQIYRFQATAWSSSDSIGLDLGRSVVCAVSEDAVEIRLFRNEAPEEPFVRQELALVPGAVNEVLVRVP
jgi:hypothetical protein